MSELKFRPTAEIYDKFAMRALRDHDVAQAIYYIKRSLQLTPLRDNYMKLAELYCSTGALMEATQVLVDMYSKYPDDVDCLIALYRISLSQGHFDSAREYQARIQAREGYFDPVYSEGIPISTTTRKPLKYEIFDRDKTILELVDKILPDNPKDAISMLATIPKSSRHYVTARKRMALCKLLAGDSDGAYGECLEILSIYPDDLTALTMAIGVLAEKEETRPLMDGYVDKINSMQIKDDGEVSLKIAYAMCEAGRHEDAVRYFDMLSSHRYDIQVMQLRAIALFNSGRVEESLIAFRQIRMIYSDHCSAKYYIDEILSGRDKPFDYLLHESLGELMRRKQKLTNLATLSQEEFLAELNDPTTVSYIKWYYTVSYEEKTLTLLSKVIVDNKKYSSAVRLIRDILRDVFVQDLGKKILIEALVTSHSTTRIKAYLRHNIGFFKPMYPDCYDQLPTVLKEAYSIAFSESCSIGEGFEQRLLDSFEIVIPRIRGRESELRSPATIAGIILLLCEDKRLPTTFDDVKDRLAVTKRTFKKYCDLLGLTEKIFR